MKTVLLVVLVVAGVLIRVLGLLPWGRTASEGNAPVRASFLLVVGIVSLAVIFGWFWLVMRPR